MKFNFLPGWAYINRLLPLSRISFCQFIRQGFFLLPATYRSIFRDLNTPTNTEHFISHDFVLIFSPDLYIITIYKAYPEQRRDSYDRYCNGI